MLQMRKVRRRAASLLEIILGLPLLLMVLFAVAQFGLLQSNQQSLKMASRAGALVAAELNVVPGEPMPGEVLDAVNEVLRQSGLIGSSEFIELIGGVQLNHNLAGGDVLVAGMGCNPPAIPYPDRPYVQVTVCLEATRLAPNTLSILGINFSNRFVSMSSLHRHELSP